jgi:hypothetical protein
MSTVTNCFFFEPREGLYTGEESPLEFLLNGTSLNLDIQAHICEFLGESPRRVETTTHLICHDNLNNEFTILVDDDEKDCFADEILDDFVVNGDIYYA